MFCPCARFNCERGHSGLEISFLSDLCELLLNSRDSGQYVGLSNVDFVFGPCGRRHCEFVKLKGLDV